MSASSCEQLLDSRLTGVDDLQSVFPVLVDPVERCGCFVGFEPRDDYEPFAGPVSAVDDGDDLAEFVDVAFGAFPDVLSVSFFDDRDYYGPHPSKVRLPFVRGQGRQVLCHRAVMDRIPPPVGSAHDWFPFAASLHPGGSPERPLEGAGDRVATLGQGAERCQGQGARCG